MTKFLHKFGETNSALERLYARSPRFLQTLMGYAYGYALHKLRYGKTYNATLREIKPSEWYGKDQLIDLQTRLLKNLIAHAYRYVPYYRETLDGLSIKPEDITSLDDLKKLPILEKSEVKKEPLRFVAQCFDVDELTVNHTSGTTGTPLDLYFDNNSIQRNWAFYEARVRNWAGVTVRDRKAMFGGRVIVPKERRRRPFWLYNPAERQLYFSSYHLNPDFLPYYVDELDEFKPKFLVGYTSSIYVIAKFIKENHIRISNPPKSVLVTSETLFEAQRETIEDTFGCKVYDGYGGGERVALITECAQGSLHMSPEYGIVEFLDQAGNPVKAGEAGEMVCTGLINWAMPLIRYRVGDMAVPSDKPCSCGRAFPVVDKIVGRVDDILVTPDGGWVGRLDPVFKGLHGVREAQIIQEWITEVRVLVVPESDFSFEVKSLLVQNLKGRLGQRVRVRVEIVDAIPRTSSGKFRSVISKVSDPLNQSVQDENSIHSSVLHHAE